MTAKEYLRQAWNIDQRIKDKLEQVTKLKEMATNVTGVLSDMPRTPTPGGHKMEDAIARLSDIEAEINSDIDRLLNLKIEITQSIWRVEDANCRTLLEMRYINFKSWEEIADAMSITVRWVHRLHSKALRLAEKFTKSSQSVH